MRLATWNINSIRSRADRALAFLERSGTDVLALQETKCKDEQFPRAGFEALGYEVATFGLNQWNGVAIVSRVGLTDVAKGFPGQPTFGTEPVEPVVEARAIGATCGGIRVWSLYVPHGRALGDPHYAYKLEWLARLRAQAEGWLVPTAGGPAAGDPATGDPAAGDPAAGDPATGNPAAQIALVGDWNVAPRDTDVWDLAFFAGQTHITPAERAAFAAFADAGYTEVTREHVPEDRKYTYWDYQQLRFPRNEGMRIDFAYASPALAARTTAVVIDRNERKGKGASDHVPVILDLAD